MRLPCYALACVLVASSTALRADPRPATASPRAHEVRLVTGTNQPSPLPTFQPRIVHSQFGGQIFGFDIDQQGIEGVLSEAQTLNDGSVLTAIETFNQLTGEIIQVVKQTTSDADDYVTLGVVGQHVGLVEFEHEVSFLHVVRTFTVLDPLSLNRLNGRWDPPIDQHHIIESVSRNQGLSLAAVYAYDNSENFRPQVFETDVATNTFGPLITMTDGSFQTGLVPKVAYNPATNKGLLGIQTLGNPFVGPTFALVDLQSGQTTIFRGVGLGDVNGLAIDPATNIACSTTEIDFGVQFYDLATLTGFSEPLPGANSQFNNGADVAVDSLHGLFLVAQPNSSTEPGTSSIYVYDEQGNLVESLNGFHFSNTFNVIRMHIALHPSLRFGYVDGPDDGVSEIQSFAY